MQTLLNDTNGLQSVAGELIWKSKKDFIADPFEQFRLCPNQFYLMK